MISVKPYLILCVIIFINGCVGVADGGYRLEGEVVDKKGNAVNGCVIEERVVEDEILISYHHVDSRFSELFTSAPYGEYNYFFVFRCGDGMEARTGDLRIKMGGVPTLSLGRITVAGK